MSNYQEFLQTKEIVDLPTGIEREVKLNPSLFPFQRDLVKWALRRGRAAIFAGTGLGKTPMQCEWARHVEAYLKKPGLILAPLAVSHQTISEAKKILGMDISLAQDADDIGKRGVYITNYEKLAHFETEVFGFVVMDESSRIKGADSKTRQAIMESFSGTPFKLCCTATPAPNDYLELGQHAEVLGVMSMNEMLSTFFVHDGGETQKWRLKGHAERDFWKWLASWSACLTKPSDLGYSNEGYDLPPLNVREVIVEAGPLDGELFASDAVTLEDQRAVRRGTMGARVQKVAELTNGNEDQWLVWCGLNDESSALTDAINDATEVTGSDSDDSKEKAMLGFADGSVSRLVTKSKICGWGMNWQNCHKMIFAGIDHSFESMYQAIRRCWRFGQKHPVDVYIVMSDRDGAILQNIKRKQADAERMQRELVEHMADLTKRELVRAGRTRTIYNPTIKMQLPSWLNSAA